MNILEALEKGVEASIKRDSEKFAKEIRQDYADGVQAGVVGTPSYLINGHLIPGSISYEMWEEIIGFILKETY